MTEINNTPPTANLPLLRDLVGPEKKVKFVCYRKGYLVYQADNGFQFDVPIDDAGDGVFLAEDKSIYFMRYIRKALETLSGASE